MTPHPGRWAALALVSVAELLCMSLWFGVSSVAPQLVADWGLRGSAAAWLTMSVQLGFVAEILGSAVFNLADILPVRQLFALCALLGAAANAVFVLAADDLVTGFSLRFLTGVFLAGIYPPAMKLLATWFRQGRGLALGVLVGALTLGKGTPYLVNALMGEGWRPKVLLASASALLGGVLLFAFAREGPWALAPARFDPRQLRRIQQARGVRAGQLRVLRPHVGAVRHVDLAPRDAARDRAHPADLVRLPPHDDLHAILLLNGMRERLSRTSGMLPWSGMRLMFQKATLPVHRVCQISARDGIG